jgi:hypothetical protein
MQFYFNIRKPSRSMHSSRPRPHICIKIPQRFHHELLKKFTTIIVPIFAKVSSIKHIISKRNYFSRFQRNCVILSSVQFPNDCQLKIQKMSFQYFFIVVSVFFYFDKFVFNFFFFTLIIIIIRVMLDYSKR